MGGHETKQVERLGNTVPVAHRLEQLQRLLVMALCVEKRATVEAPVPHAIEAPGDDRRLAKRLGAPERIHDIATRALQIAAGPQQSKIKQALPFDVTIAVASGASQ